MLEVRQPSLANIVELIPGARVGLGFLQALLLGVSAEPDLTTEAAHPAPRPCPRHADVLGCRIDIHACSDQLIEPANLGD